MPRVRKNAGERTIEGDPGAKYVATLLNPVDHRLYDLVDLKYAYYLFSPMPNEAYSDPEARFIEYGHGSFDDDDSKDIYYDGEEGEYFRSHTPGGVTKKKSGLGLLLYSGLALAVVLEKGREGIFSETKDRSNEASTWWKAQVTRDYAEEGEDTVYGSGLITVDIDEDMILEDVRSAAGRGYFGESIQEVDEDDVQIIEGPDPSYIEVEVSVEATASIQYLPAVKVAESKLVIAWNEGDSDLDSLMEEKGEHPSPEILSEVDMSTVGDPDLILLLWGMVKDSDISEAKKKRFLNNVPKGPLIDADPRILEMMGQLRLPFEELLKEEVAANPPREVKHSKAWAKAFAEFI